MVPVLVFFQKTPFTWLTSLLDLHVCSPYLPLPDSTLLLGPRWYQAMS